MITAAVGGVALMGILNVNADSFSDPRPHDGMGRRPTSSVDALVTQGLRLFDSGATVIDVGAESASPSTPVLEAARERDLLAPVVAGLTAHRVAVSVDTYKTGVASACIDAGARLINDYSGLADPQLAGLCADTGTQLVLTHNPTGPKTKRLATDAYQDVTGEVISWFERQIERVEALGLPRQRLLLDPGIDLAKTPGQSLTLLRDLDRLAGLGPPILAAISRKDVIGALTHTPPRFRDPGTLALLGRLATMEVPAIARVHDVAAAAQYLTVTAALDPADDRRACDLHLAPHLRRETPRPQTDSTAPADKPGPPTHRHATHQPDRTGPRPCRNGNAATDHRSTSANVLTPWLEQATRVELDDPAWAALHRQAHQLTRRLAAAGLLDDRLVVTAADPPVVVARLLAHIHRQLPAQEPDHRPAEEPEQTATPARLCSTDTHQEQT